MRKLYALTIALMAVIFASAQISVTVTGNTNTTPALQASYSSLAAALTDLNAVTAMTGPVTLTLAAGSSETVPPAGLTIGGSSLNAVLSNTNTITIIKAAGANSALLMPNLIEQTAVLRVNAARTAKISWTVVDIQGRAIMRFDQQVNGGQNDRMLQLGKLAAGTYQLNGTTDKGKTIIIRFVKQ